MGPHAEDSRSARLQSGHKDVKLKLGFSRWGETPRIAAIGPATGRAIEQRGAQVHVVPKEYVAEVRRAKPEKQS